MFHDRFGGNPKWLKLVPNCPFFVLLSLFVESSGCNTKALCVLCSLF